MKDTTVFKIAFAAMFALLAYVMVAHILLPAVNQFVAQTADSMLDSLLKF